MLWYNHTNKDLWKVLQLFYVQHVWDSYHKSHVSGSPGILFGSIVVPVNEIVGVIAPNALYFDYLKIRNLWILILIVLIFFFSSEGRTKNVKLNCIRTWYLVKFLNMSNKDALSNLYYSLYEHRSLTKNP